MRDVYNHSRARHCNNSARAWAAAEPKSSKRKEKRPPLYILAEVPCCTFSTMLMSSVLIWSQKPAMSARMASPSGAKCTAFTMQSCSSVAARRALVAALTAIVAPEDGPDAPNELQLTHFAGLLGRALLCFDLELQLGQRIEHRLLERNIADPATIKVIIHIIMMALV